MKLPESLYEQDSNPQAKLAKVYSDTFNDRSENSSPYCHILATVHNLDVGQQEETG